MLLKQESLPQANIYSSKILFEQPEDRNKKRMNQILKRKKALSTRNKTTKIEEEKSDIFPKNEKEEINLNTFCQFNSCLYGFNYINENEDNQKTIKEKKNAIKNDVNNNSTNHNSSILNKDSQEKEVNISNLEEDTSDIIISNQNNQNQNGNENSTVQNINSNKRNNNNVVNIDIINLDETFNDESKENNYYGSNEFAIKYLSSSLDSFVKLDNHLVAKAKYQNNCFTDSYSQALELTSGNSMSSTYKTLFSKNYLVTDVIKEEKESETPLKVTKKKEKDRHKNNFNYNLSIEEIEMIKKVERRRAYSRRIRKNFMNKNLKEDYNFISSRKNIDFDRTTKLNTSKSCKKFKKNNIMNMAQIKEFNEKNKNYCSQKNLNINLKNSLQIKRKKNFDDISNSIYNNNNRRTIFGFRNKIKLNNSFILNNKDDKNSLMRKTLTTINSSKNIYKKRENLLENLTNSRSNLNIFKKSNIQNNKLNLNASMKNFHPKLIRKDKIRNSKSAKKLNNISKNYLNNKGCDLQKKSINLKLSFKLNNTNKNNNTNNHTLKKNPTMGRLTFYKVAKNNKKEDISKNVKKENLNKTVLVTKSNTNANTNNILNKTISSKNIICKKFINNFINSRNSMPFKAKAKKIAKNILNNGNSSLVSKLKSNRSSCYLINKNKISK